MEDLECGRGKLALVLKEGSEHLLTFNLYSADTLKALIAPNATVVDLGPLISSSIGSRPMASGPGISSTVCPVARRS